MKSLEEIHAGVQNYLKMLHWLIDGLGVHGLKISDARIINWEWVKRNYNVTEPCEHKEVAEIKGVLSFHGGGHGGYCNHCDAIVVSTGGITWKTNYETNKELKFERRWEKQ